MPMWVAKVAMGLGFVADAGLIVLLLLAAGTVFSIPASEEGRLALIAAWAVALVVSVIAPLYGLRQWRRQRRDLALAGVWLPPLGLLVGALTTAL